MATVGADSRSTDIQSVIRVLSVLEVLNQESVTSVDVAQAQTQLETVRAQLIDVNQGRAQFEHAIATLTNLQAGELTIGPAPLDTPIPNIPLGLPSQLIERRPDVAAAERRVSAANAEIGVATAAFYPTITLNGSGGFDSTHIGTLFQGPAALWSLGAQASELLFDAGSFEEWDMFAEHRSHDFACRGEPRLYPALFHLARAVGPRDSHPHAGSFSCFSDRGAGGRLAPGQGGNPERGLLFDPAPRRALQTIDCHPSFQARPGGVTGGQPRVEGGGCGGFFPAGRSG